ncbi:hypothetical protein D3C76_1301710 [compost metagenome]
MNTTKANSPPEASTTPRHNAWGWLSPPAVRPRPYSKGSLMTTSSRVSPSTSSGMPNSRLRSALIPTPTKNSPSSRPLIGSIWVSSSWRKGESAISTPARKAPNAIDTPTCSITQAVPSTTSKAVAVDSSGKPEPTVHLKTGVNR